LLIGDVDNTLVNWVSSNPNVAMITSSKGLTAINQGSTIVTAYYGGESVKESFTILQKDITVSPDKIESPSLSKTVVLKNVMNESDLTTFANYVKQTSPDEYIISGNTYFHIENIDDNNIRNIINKVTNVDLTNLFNDMEFVISDKYEIIFDENIVECIDMMKVIRGNTDSQILGIEGIINSIGDVKWCINRYLIARSLQVVGGELSEFAGKLSYQCVSDPLSVIDVKKGFYEALQKYTKSKIDISSLNTIGSYYWDFAISAELASDLEYQMKQWQRVADICSDDDKLKSFENCLYVNNSIFYLSKRYRNTWSATESLIVSKLPQSRMESAGKAFMGSVNSFMNSFKGEVIDDALKVDATDKPYVKLGQEILKLVKAFDTGVNIAGVLDTALKANSTELKEYIEARNAYEKDYSEGGFYRAPKTYLVGKLIEYGKYFQ
jgi:hypothetical protein